jgi:hypothetical protein
LFLKQIFTVNFKDFSHNSASARHFRRALHPSATRGQPCALLLHRERTAL